MFALLRLCSFALSALQLRSGFPPRASLHGGGRQRFFWFRRADVVHQFGYYAFMVRLHSRTPPCPAHRLDTDPINS